MRLYTCVQIKFDYNNNKSVLFLSARSNGIISLHLLAFSQHIRAAKK